MHEMLIANCTVIPGRAVDILLAVSNAVSLISLRITQSPENYTRGMCFMFWNPYGKL